MPKNDRKNGGTEENGKSNKARRKQMRNAARGLIKGGFDPITARANGQDITELLGIKDP